MSKITIKQLLLTRPIGTVVKIQGWVRNKRDSKQVTFLMVNDGSVIHHLQVVVDTQQLTVPPMGVGASVALQGRVSCVHGKEDLLELQATSIAVIGDAVGYPLQPKKHSLEFLREIAHLRFRTNTFGAIFRIRHNISYAIHQFFHEKGFFYIHTPIITAIDAEGAGQMFTVSTFDLAKVPINQVGEVDFKKDFFEQKTNLTVSGQLEGEAAAMGLGAIYTFGPTFRAENSNTTRHLAEFWMIEPELAFCDLAGLISLAETFLKYVIQFCLDNCLDDLNFLQQREAAAKLDTDPNYVPLLTRLQQVGTQPFVQITYSQALQLLQEAVHTKNQQFAYPVAPWGIDLQSEHERYLVEQHFKRPVIITHYPRQIKAFYMRQEDDDTVAAMDILFPGMGEIVGGSQREERWDYLQAAMHRTGMHPEKLAWYMQTRLFGSVPHAGFGLGLERLVQFITGMDNIRDVIPFPRTPGNAAF